MTSLRFADYFFRAGLSPSSSLSSRRLVPGEANLELSSISLDNVNDKGSRKAPHPLSFTYEPETLYRFPRNDIDPNNIYPTHTPMFCFPSDIVLVQDQPEPHFHSFIITDLQGAKLYGVCLTTYTQLSKQHVKQLDKVIEEWRDENLGDTDYEFARHVAAQLALEKERLLKMHAGLLTPEAGVEETIQCLEEIILPLKSTVLVEAEGLWISSCVGVLSRWPWFDVLKDWLCLLVEGCTDTGDMRCVINLLMEIPLPPPGKLELKIPFGNSFIYCCRPPLNNSQNLRNFSIWPVFRSLSIDTIVTLFELLLTEYKVVMLSEHASMLTLTTETLIAWLYPLQWHHVTIPVLSSRLLDYLQAPVPYFVGIVKKSFPQWRQERWRPTDCAVCDLDSNTIDFPPLKVRIPSKERKKLISSLSKHSGSDKFEIRKGVPESMKTAFPHGRVVLASSESVIGRRRIKDIPQSMYGKYTNAFLKEKAAGKISPLKKPDGLFSPVPPTPTQFHPAVGFKANRESYASFVSPRPSHIDRSDTTKSRDVTSIASSFQQATVSPEPSVFSSQEDPASRVASSVSSKSPWWQTFSPVKPAPTESLVAASTDILEVIPQRPSIVTKHVKTPSMFERILGIQDGNSIAATTTMTIPPNILEDSPLSPVTNIEINEVVNSPNLSVVCEGHVFHELILAEHKDAGIDDELKSVELDEEEYADRFTPSLNSSDDFSKAESQLERPAFFKRQQRAPGQSRASQKDLNIQVNSKKSPETNAWPKVRITEKLEECRVCKEGYDVYYQSVLMCQSNFNALIVDCHVQIHSDCLRSIENFPCAAVFNEDKINQGFFKIFTSLLRHYRAFLRIPPTEKLATSEESEWFRKQDFLADFDSETRVFMSIILDTQAYAQFILDRVERPEDDYEIMHFDESIKQKMNRSRIKFTKEHTPFLNETTYQITTAINTIPFNTLNLPNENFHAKDPLDWVKKYEIEPRPIQLLLTESDKQMMKSHTQELVQRSRIAAIVFLIVY